MKHLKGFIDLSEEFRKYVQKIIDKMTKDVFPNFYDDPKYILGEQIRTDIKEILEEFNFEKKAFDYILKSVRLETKTKSSSELKKNMEKTETLESGTVNVLEKVSISSYLDRIIENLQRKLLPLFDRVKFLKRLLPKSPNKERVKKALKELKKTETVYRRVSRETQREIDVQYLLLKEQEDQAQKTYIRVKISQLKTRKKEADEKIKEIRSKIKLFEKDIEQINKEEYQYLITTVLKELLEKEALLVFQYSLMKTLYKYTMGTAQNQLMYEIRRSILKEAEQMFSIGKKVIIKVKLSLLHNIYDICDFMEGEYIFPKLPKEGLPPYHPWCMCDIILIIKEGDA